MLATARATCRNAQPLDVQKLSRRKSIGRQENLCRFSGSRVGGRSGWADNGETIDLVPHSGTRLVVLERHTAVVPESGTGASSGPELGSGFGAELGAGSAAEPGGGPESGSPRAVPGSKTPAAPKSTLLFLVYREPQPHSVRPNRTATRRARGDGECAGEFCARLPAPNVAAPEKFAGARNCLSGRIPRSLAPAPNSRPARRKQFRAELHGRPRAEHYGQPWRRHSRTASCGTH